MDEAVLSALKHGTHHHKPKHLKEIHIREQHDGSYHVERHSGRMNEPPMEHNEDGMDGVHAAVEDHLGTPNEGEEELGEGQPGMGGQNAVQV